MFKQLIDKARKIFSDTTEIVIEKSREQEIVTLLTQLEEKETVLKSDLDTEKITDEVFLKSFTELRELESELKVELESLEKGGEGSKGGKVIGHTRSGKPIYDSHEHSEHKDFTKQDHADAHNLHWQYAGNANTGKEQSEHWKQAGFHAKKTGFNENSTHNKESISHAKKEYKKSAKKEESKSLIDIAKLIDAANKTETINKELIRLNGGHASPESLALNAARLVMNGEKLNFEYQKKEKVEKSEQIETTLEKSDTKTYYVDCLIYNNQNKLLLLRRSNIDTFEPNKWSLPGGKIEAGENIMQAVIREVLEETNIKLTADQLRLLAVKETDKVCIYYFNFYPFIDNGANKVLENIILDNEEHINFQFVTQQERRKMKLLLDLNDTLDTLQNYSYDKNSEVKVPLLNDTNEAKGTKSVKIEDLKSE